MSVSLRVAPRRLSSQRSWRRSASNGRQSPATTRSSRSSSEDGSLPAARDDKLPLASGGRISAAAAFRTSPKCTRYYAGTKRPGYNVLLSKPALPERIIEIAYAFWHSKALFAAVELDVFTKLAAGPLDLEALTARTGVHPRAARDFFDALVALELLERD